MNFFASVDFLQFAAAFLGGLLAGVWLNERKHRRDNEAAMRSRQPRFIEVPFVGHGGRQVETLTCDRRERTPGDCAGVESCRAHHFFQPKNKTPTN